MSIPDMVASFDELCLLEMRAFMSELMAVERLA